MVFPKVIVAVMFVRGLHSYRLETFIEFYCVYSRKTSSWMHIAIDGRNSARFAEKLKQLQTIDADQTRSKVEYFINLFSS
jgi:hypothetical protein